MWLVVFAPIVSQLIEQSRSHQDAVVACTEMNMGDMHMSSMQMGNMHMCSAASHAADAGHHASSATTMAACGYCDLLATHAAMPALASAAEAAYVLLTFSAAPVLSTRFTPIGAFPSGRPRAPPVVS